MDCQAGEDPGLKHLQQSEIVFCQRLLALFSVCCPLLFENYKENTGCKDEGEISLAVIKMQ